MLRASYKFRLYPTVAQTKQLYDTRFNCWFLYNGCILERRGAWKTARKSIRHKDQRGQLPEIKKADPDWKLINAQVLQDVTDRADIAYTRFFKGTSGFPHLQKLKDYKSFTYPQAYAQIKTRDDRIFFPKLGWIKWALWKTIEELARVRMKTATIKLEADGWYVCLSCEIPEPKPLPDTNRACGIDPGLTNLMTVHDGQTATVLGDLGWLKEKDKKVRRAQKDLSRKKKGSKRWKKQVNVVARRYQDLARAKKYQLDCMTKLIVDSYDIICIEDTNIAGLVKAGAHNAQGRGLRRNLHLAGIGQMKQMLYYKVWLAQRIWSPGAAPWSSQECFDCGAIVPKKLSERTHHCPTCGLNIGRDENAAGVILKRGLLKLGISMTEYLGPLRGEEGQQAASVKREVQLSILDAA